MGIFSDFDGTLSEITADPERVVINPKSKECLTKLSNYLTVGVISGRPVMNLKQMVGIENIYYAGNHGAEIDNDGLFIFPQAKEAAPYIREIYTHLSKTIMAPFGLDFKSYSASIHYRNHPKPEEAKKIIYNLLESYLSNDLLEINNGRMVVEIRIKGINKATALKKILNNENLDSFIYFGDDTTDVDIFKMRLPGQVNIAVENIEVNRRLYKYADYFVKDPVEVATMLHELLETVRHCNRESR